MKSSIVQSTTENPLKDVIRKEILKKGPITFAQLMKLALYHPNYGYYRRNNKIGLEGDFYTAPEVSYIFGWMLAKQLVEISSLFIGNEEEGAKFCIYEFGSASGQLSKEILTYCREFSPELLAQIKYVLIDWYDENQKAEIEGELASYGKVELLTPLEFEKLALETTLRGCVISNEFIDAQPVHRVIYRNGSLKEIYIDNINGQLVETEGKLSTCRLITYLANQEITLKEGQLVEINLNALPWLETLGKSFDKLVNIVIDYGEEAESLYHKHRINGTLRCYFDHEIIENIYDFIGECDITASVNFTALKVYGEYNGLKSLPLVKQGQFLQNLGIVDEIINKKLNIIDQYKLGNAIKTLFYPNGMGEIFKVLIQYKGINKLIISGVKKEKGL